MSKKTKVAWLCYFSNKKIQEEIKPLKPVNEYAPWISNLIPLFENNTKIDLHIISPHPWLSRNKYFSKQGIHYYFIKSGMPFIGRPWPSFFKFDYWTDDYFWKRDVKKLVQIIAPDLIHLHGAENIFCDAIIQFKDKYPVFITLQGFLHKIASTSTNPRVQRRIQNELFIYKNFNHFGYRTGTMKEVVQKLNVNSRFHFHQYPYSINPLMESQDKKKYDIVFFARITESKGILDLLEALIIVKKRKKDISLCVIGKANNKFLVRLKDFCKIKGISQNVEWTGFLPTQKDVHQEASKAKVTVLPTHYDMIPGTIIESMFLKIPVIAYRTGSIPEINANDEVIKLIPIADIGGMANAITELLRNKELRKEMAQKGYQRANEMFGQNKVRQEILNAYNKTIIDFNN